jgi:hypothetical protein
MLNFLVHEYSFYTGIIFPPKKLQQKIYLPGSQDPDPNGFKSRIRIRSKIVRSLNTGQAEPTLKHLKMSIVK